MFDITHESDERLECAPHYSRLDEFESCLLSLTFATGCTSNLSVSEAFDSGSGSDNCGLLKYYYDLNLKIFQNFYPHILYYFDLSSICIFEYIYSHF